MRLILAPMEGVLDAAMRALLTRIGGYDRCVTEFVRITNQQLPARVFQRRCPELLQGGHTAAGVPVYVQLLGGDPDYMALNARTVETLGAPGIDLNFGCPSKTVNRNDGGSTLLREPERVHRIVTRVRQAVSPQVPVTVKIRLGFHDSSLLEDIVCGIEAAHATELCIHARTRLDGYKPPAYWEQIGRIRTRVRLPLIANGEIWSPADAHQARQESGCPDLMLGRGALSRPDLALAIRQDQADTPIPDTALLHWPQIQVLLYQHSVVMSQNHPKYAVSRIKQWLTYLRRQYPEAGQLFAHLKRLSDLHTIQQVLAHPDPRGFAHESR